MKKLITSGDVKALSSGQKILYVEPGTIITPAARDTAADLGISIKNGTAPVQASVQAAVQTQGVTAPQAAAPDLAASGVPVPRLEDISANLIAEIVRKVLDSLPGVPKESEPVRDIDKSGVVLVKGESVQMETFDTGNPKDRVGLKETMTRELSPHLAAGFMEMEETSFDWTLTYNEMDYVIEGTLDIIVDGKTYRGQAGDVFYIPEGTSITFATPDKCKFFYVTTPWPAFL